MNTYKRMIKKLERMRKIVEGMEVGFVMEEKESL